MKLNRIILPIVMLVASTQIYSMDRVLEEAGRAAGRGINIARAEMPIANMNSNHVYGEHLTINNHGNAEPYVQGQPFMSQMRMSFLSGLKQSVFSAGNVGDKILDYGVKIGVTLLVELGMNSAYKLWNLSSRNNVQQEAQAQKRLAHLAAHNELLQSIAAQLSRMPRLTEEDKASYATMQKQYATMFKAFTQDAHDYMQTHGKAEKAV